MAKGLASARSAPSRVGGIADRRLCHLIASHVIARLIPKPVAPLDLLEAMSGCALVPEEFSGTRYGPYDEISHDDLTLLRAGIGLKIDDPNYHARRRLMNKCWLSYHGRYQLQMRGGPLGYG